VADNLKKGRLQEIFKQRTDNIKFKNITPEQNEIADRRYKSSVYFYTLFLYVM